jgi:transposase
MRYTTEEREALARCKEQWILRTERGEDPERVRRELKLPLKASSLPSLKHRYQRGGRKWQALWGRRHGVATKGTAAVKAFLAKAKARHPQLTGAELCVQVWERFELEISLSRLNELLHEAGLSNTPGRPSKAPAADLAAASGREVAHAGAFFPSGRAHGTGRARRRAPRD